MTNVVISATVGAGPRLSVRADPKWFHRDRLAVLDGWRGISILSVLACHLLPLGPKPWQLNSMAGPFGMAIFFTLSGFLITDNLMSKPDARSFFIRRACRILPLLCAFVPVVVVLQGSGFRSLLAHFLFAINYQTQFMTPVTSPLWSLCVEVHFYIFVGLLVATRGHRILVILPFLAVCVTAARVWQEATISIHTHLRVDEILAGATVALVHSSSRAVGARAWLARIHPVALVAFLCLCCHPVSGPMAYLRPYAAAAAVACTLWRDGAATSILKSRSLKYLADISYALYVIHPINRYGWFGSGAVWERYLLKRPVGILLTFLLAHLSSFCFERRWIDLGKRWSMLTSPKPALRNRPAASPLT